MVSISHSLAGNCIWAIGHSTNSESTRLYYFDGVLRGSHVWIKFSLPLQTHDHKLYLGTDGLLLVLSGSSLFFANIKSIRDCSDLSWILVKEHVVDSAIGTDLICYRLKTSDSIFALSFTSSSNTFSEKRIPVFPKTEHFVHDYCVSPSDDIIVLSSNGSLFILSLGENIWKFIPASLPSSDSFFRQYSCLPFFSKILAFSGFLWCLYSVKNEIWCFSLSAKSISWRVTKLEIDVKDLCSLVSTLPSSSPHSFKSFLLLDSQFSLWKFDFSVSSSVATQPTLLSPNSLPNLNTFFHSIHSITFNNSFNINSSITRSFSDPFHSPISDAPSPHSNLKLEIINSNNNSDSVNPVMFSPSFAPGSCSDSNIYTSVHTRPPSLPSIFQNSNLLTFPNVIDDNSKQPINIINQSDPLSVNDIDMLPAYSVYPLIEYHMNNSTSASHNIDVEVPVTASDALVISPYSVSLDSNKSLIRNITATPGSDSDISRFHQIQAFHTASYEPQIFATAPYQDKNQIVHSLPLDGSHSNRDFFTSHLEQEEFNSLPLNIEPNFPNSSKSILSKRSLLHPSSPEMSSLSPFNLKKLHLTSYEGCIHEASDTNHEFRYSKLKVLVRNFPLTCEQFLLMLPTYPLYQYELSTSDAIKEKASVVQTKCQELLCSEELTYNFLFAKKIQSNLEPLYGQKCASPVNVHSSPLILNTDILTHYSHSENTDILTPHLHSENIYPPNSGRLNLLSDEDDSLFQL